MPRNPGNGEGKGTSAADQPFSEFAPDFHH
jgi:hypothetical protein